MTRPLPPALHDLTAGFDRSPEHVVITDRDGVILYANAGAAEHTGYAVEDMIGRRPGELWGGRMSREFYEDMWATIREQKQAFVGDMRNVRKDGTPYWQEVHIIPVLDAKERPRCYIGIELRANDESQREALLRDARGDGERRLRVRWPLDWLFEAGNLSAGQLQDLREQYGRHEGALDTLVADLLAISNVLHASKEPDATFAVDALAEEVIAEVRAAHPDRTYRCESRPSPLELCENRRFVADALRRLVANAAQYTPPGSGDVVVLLLRSSHHCVIRCQDNGIGISFKEQRRMFDKFYRGARARSLHPAGSGLGLYLVKTIADLRGWALSCVSEPQAGACFELRIPLRQKPPRPRRRAPQPRAARAPLRGGAGSSGRSTGPRG